MSLTHKNSDAPRLGGLGAPCSNNLVSCVSGDREGSQCCSFKELFFWFKVGCLLAKS